MIAIEPRDDHLLILERFLIKNYVFTDYQYQTWNRQVSSILGMASKLIEYRYRPITSLLYLRGCKNVRGYLFSIAVPAHRAFPLH